MIRWCRRKVFLPQLQVLQMRVLDKLDESDWLSKTKFRSLSVCRQSIGGSSCEECFRFIKKSYKQQKPLNNFVTFLPEKAVCPFPAGISRGRCIRSPAEEVEAAAATAATAAPTTLTTAEAAATGSRRHLTGRCSQRCPPCWLWPPRSSWRPTLPGSCLRPWAPDASFRLAPGWRHSPLKEVLWKIRDWKNWAPDIIKSLDDWMDQRVFWKCVFLPREGASKKLLKLHLLPSLSGKTVEF